MSVGGVGVAVTLPPEVAGGGGAGVQAAARSPAPAQSSEALFIPCLNLISRIINLLLRAVLCSFTLILRRSADFFVLPKLDVAEGA